MSKEIFIARFSLIIRRLERGPATYEQIAQYLENESTIQDKNFSISKRTLQRDIKDIYSQLNIEIVNEKKGDKRYFIKNKTETLDYGQRILESYQIINVITTAQGFSDIVFLESRKPKGLEHFYGLVFAIKNKRIISFQHFKFWDDRLTLRKVHPLGLKEAQNRWYLIAVDTKDNKLKTFGLDRIDDIDISKTRFNESYGYNLHQHFVHAFGITNDESRKPQLVRIKFNYQQGQYIKAFPLHGSQKIITENETEVIIEVYIYVTYDFIKELLSCGPEMQILSPQKLRSDIKKLLQKAVMLNS